jgi:hypothetical protein
MSQAVKINPVRSYPLLSSEAGGKKQKLFLFFSRRQRQTKMDIISP